MIEAHETIEAAHEGAAAASEGDDAATKGGDAPLAAGGGVWRLLQCQPMPTAEEMCNAGRDAVRCFLPRTEPSPHPYPHP